MKRESALQERRAGRLELLLDALLCGHRFRATNRKRGGAKEHHSGA
jgi:hypothetical protein